MHSCLSEFNEEAFWKVIHDEGYGEGYLNAALKSIKIMKKMDIPKEVIISELITEYEMSEEYAGSLVNKHWQEL